MNIVSTARTVFMASVIVLTAGIGAQAKSSVLDVKNSAVTAPTVMSYGHKITKDNYSLLGALKSDADEYGMRGASLGREAKTFREAVNLIVTPHSENGGASR